MTPKAISGKWRILVGALINLGGLVVLVGGSLRL
jgi:hypothetical protein